MLLFMLLFMLFLLIGTFVIILGWMSEFVILFINNYTIITFPNLIIPKIFSMLLVFYLYSLELEKVFLSFYLSFKLKFKLLTITQSLTIRIALSIIMLTFFILLNILRRTISDDILFVLITIPFLSLFGFATKNWFDTHFDILNKI